ncbi:CocE/NonD family hydrolase [Flavobacterium kingsejongi]|uniref:CocE/NonD family hydrolase n=1 Tax=Flavobacterium kingsejongi TaxID=1678728 RepID=UPI0021CF1A14|nr:CocE/NonD family hydrolase [Flavobacterium kingsejongi]
MGCRRFYGPQADYHTLERNDDQDQNIIIIGPWNHGGWAMGPGNKLGNLDFGIETGPFFRKEIQAKWFAYHLKGKGDGKFPEATVFQTGSNQWKNYTAWPPKNTTLKNIYFHSNGKLSFEKPDSQEQSNSDSFVSDPAKPVPYRARPIEATYSRDSRWSNWLTEDQRFVHNRPDVLSWETEALKDDLTITGNVMAKIYAATSGSDADWVVKLIDVYPAIDIKDPKMSGYQMMIANDVFRGRFRNSFSNPEPITPNKVELYTIDLHGTDHVFKKGHKIMVQIQSSLFPIIDRNPQKYVPNIFEAKESDFQTAIHKVFHSLKFSSSLVLPMVQ